jgi:hypothetical protein
MRQSAASLAFAFWIAVNNVAPGAEGQPYILENQSLRLEIQTSPAPFVSRLVHKASSQAVLTAPTSKSLFAIIVAAEDGQQTTISSLQAGESSVSQADEGGRLLLRYAKFPGVDLAVEVAVTCHSSERLTKWSIRIENSSGQQLKRVRFPELIAVPSIGDGDDDCLVLPAMAGTLIENPAKTWRTGQNVTLSYPGNLSAQFLAYQDRSAGLYIAGTDTAGYPMSLGVSKENDGYRCWHEFTPVADAAIASKISDGQVRVWESPYPVALGVTQGTWCDTADEYKRWAIQQPWCALSLARRSDIPGWWKAGPAVHVVEVRTYDDARKCTGSYYPELQDHLRNFRDKIDGPVVPMLAGWENHRRWTGGDYFPVFDEEAARQVLPQLKQSGFRPFFYLSGLFFTHRNEGRDGEEIAAADRHMQSYVIEAPSGKPRTFVLNESSPSGEWKRHSYEFCAGAAETAEFFCNVIDRAHELGVDVMQMDQTTGGAGDVCQATTHTHAPGAGLYQSRDFWKLLQAMRSRGKSNTPDFVLFHEEPHEQLIPYLDGFHVREYYEKRWYRGYPGAVGIPLFSYLYHEYAIGYGGDSAGLSKTNDRWNVRSHAVNMISGRTPGAAIWSTHQSMYDAHPDQIAMIRNHSRLFQTRAAEFLMLGTMLHPYELAVPKLALGIRVQTNGKWRIEGVPTPAILTSSWQAPDGRIGHLFVNIDEAIQPLTVSVDTRNRPAGRKVDVEIYRSTGDRSFQPLWPAATLPREFATELQPGEVVFIELR